MKYVVYMKTYCVQMVIDWSARAHENTQGWAGQAVVDVTTSRAIASLKIWGRRGGGGVGENLFWENKISEVYFLHFYEN